MPHGPYGPESESRSVRWSAHVPRENIWRRHPLPPIPRLLSVNALPYPSCLASPNTTKSFYPRRTVLHIILLGGNSSPTSQNQCLQSLFGEFLGNQTAGDTGAHNYGVICFRWHDLF